MKHGDSAPVVVILILQAAKDIRDGSTVLSQILNMTDWQVNPNSIAFMGISYGAGLSLLITAHDERITTCIALSGWAELSKMASTNGYSVNEFWIHRLYHTALKKGKATNFLNSLFKNALNQNITFLNQMGKISSPLSYLDLYNHRQVPIFISSNFGDPLFLPQYMIEFYEKLTVPKFLMLNQGIHAAPSLDSEDIPSFNPIWRHVHSWIDYWLKNKPTKIYTQGQIRLDVSSLSSYFKSVAVTQPLETPSAYPRITYYLKPRMNNQFGTLSSMPANITYTDSIYYSKDQSVSVGIPLVSSISLLNTIYSIKIICWRLIALLRLYTSLYH